MKLFGVIIISALLLFGCSGGGDQTKAAVQQGVIEYLSSRDALDVGAMDIEVTNVTFEGEEATADVSFKAKGSTDPEAGMKIQYTLERKANRWVVKGKEDAGGSPHGGGMENPHRAMPLAEGGEMPAGHPPMAGGADETKN